MPPQKPSLLPRNFWRSLIAVLVGNAIYFSVMSLLPVGARHRPGNLDLGLVIDFWICVVIYGVIEVIYRRKNRIQSRP